MLQRDPASKKYLILLLIGVMMVVAGCDGEIPGLAPATATNTPAPTVTLTPTSTPKPTPTPLPPVGVFLAPAQADPEWVAEIQPLLSEWIPENGMRFQIRPSLSVDDLGKDDFEIIIALPPAPDLAGLISAAPDTRFLAVGVQDLDPAPNLTLIGGDGDRLDQQGFIAGFIAAVITPDWRTGVISVADSEEGQEARQGFITGVRYYCGLCLPTYPPFLKYPLYVELLGSATEQEWQAAADFLIQRSVETIYVVPGAGNDQLLRYLARSEIKIIAGVTPPAEAGDQWVASLRFSPLQVFQEAWPVFVSGQDGKVYPVPLSIMDVNPDLLSPGRQRLVEETLANLLDGFIDTGPMPADNP
jgi:hypothetical protein